MAEVETLVSFAIPRHTQVETPPPRAMLCYPAGSEFRIPYLWPSAQFQNASGGVVIWRGDTLPIRFRQSLKLGRLVAFRDGLLFFPDRALGVLKDMSREPLEAAGKLLRFHAADLEWKSLWSDPPDIVEKMQEGAEKAAEFIEKHLAKETPASPFQVHAAMLLKHLAHKDGLCLPFANLVEVKAMVVKGLSFTESFSLSSGGHLALRFETKEGIESRYLLWVAEAGAGGQALFGYFHPDFRRWPLYEDGTLSRYEALATVLLAARAAAEIAYFTEKIEDDRLPPGTRQEPAVSIDQTDLMVFHDDLKARREKLMRAREKCGLTEQIIAKAVLAMMAQTAANFQTLPFARHEMPNPIAELEASARGG